MKPKKEKKPFKDTKFFNAVKRIAPEVLDVATDVLATVYPPLSIVNNIADSAIDKLRSKGGSGVEVLIEEIQSETSNYAEDRLAYLADVQDAREMYESSGGEMADQIAKRVIDFNLWLILGLVLIQVGVVMYVDGPVGAVITGVVGTVTGALIQERNTVINFFFGSSQGSKDKDLSR